MINPDKATPNLLKACVDTLNALPPTHGKHIYFLNPLSRRIEKAYQGRDGNRLIVIYPEGEHAALVVSILIDGQFLSTPTNLETNKTTRLTAAQWEQAYQLLGE